MSGDRFYQYSSDILDGVIEHFDCRDGSLTLIPETGPEVVIPAPGSYDDWPSEAAAQRHVDFVFESVVGLGFTADVANEFFVARFTVQGRELWSKKGRN